MLFTVEEDRGDYLSGYVVSDGFVETLRIQIFAGGEVRLERPADDPRPALVAAGRHQSGLCGFTVDETALPGLSQMADLEIREITSGALIYRRFQPHYIPRRVLRLETHLFPLWRFDAALGKHFQYYAHQIEALGRETVLQMFLLARISSVYLSGRLLYRAFAEVIEGHFDVAFTMHHPYEELAERLILLARIHRSGEAIMGLRENMSLESTMAFAQSLPFSDERALGRALRDMPSAVARVLANPVTRQLTVLTPDAMPTKAALSSALTTLSTFQLVGLRRASDTFNAALREFLGLPEDLPDNARLPGVVSLARMLKRTREVEWLIEQDLALYNHIAGAYRTSQISRDEL